MCDIRLYILALPLCSGTDSAPPLVARVTKPPPTDLQYRLFVILPAESGEYDLGFLLNTLAKTSFCWPLDRILGYRLLGDADIT